MRTLLVPLLLLPAVASAQTRFVADAADANATLILNGIDAFFNQGDFSHLDLWVAEDDIEHEATAGQAPGREGLRAFVTAMRGAFPHLHYAIDEVMA